MRTLTVVTPKNHTLPPDLAPLIAPVRLSSGDDAGRATGVVLEEDAGILAFVIELASTLERGRPWTVVPASSVTVTDDSALLLSFNRDELLAQPRIRRSDTGMKADASVAPMLADGTPGPSAGGSANANQSVAEGIEGGAIGAVVGAMAGIAAGGPLALALAAFFATGGVLIGLVSGASKRLPEDPEEAKRIATSTSDGSRAALGRLSATLHDPTLANSGLVDVARFEVDDQVSRPPQTVATAHRIDI